MTNTQESLADLWDQAFQDQEFQFEIKAQDTGLTLARALAESGKSKADLARDLQWKPSRVSRVFSGEGNLTLRTLFKVTTALSLDFDVVLRKKQQPRAAQPWERRQMQDDIQRWHRDARANHHESRALLKSVRLLNRMQWQRAKRPYAQSRLQQDAPRLLSLQG